MMVNEKCSNSFEYVTFQQQVRVIFFLLEVVMMDKKFRLFVLVANYGL